MLRIIRLAAIFLMPYMLNVIYNSPSLRAQSAVEGDWTSTFTWGMGGGVEAIHISMLPTGKVIFWSTWRESVGLWDPTTELFSVAGNRPSHNPFCSGHAWLPDGRLLIAGGHISDFNGENRADIYNPFTNMWANADPNAADVPNMGSTSSNTATSGKRWYPSATTLGNGDVLVLSGDVTQLGNTNRTAQIYRAGTNTWQTLTGALRPSNDLLPEYPRVFLAPDGRAVSLSDYSDDTEYLDMSGNGSWSYLQDTLDSNLHNYGPAVMYDTGKIAYIGGGYNPTANISLLDLNNPSPSWAYGSDTMAQPRRQNNATILANGTVLITGGTYIADWNDPDGLIAAAEIWDPVTEQVTQVAEANVNIYRGYHSTALLLPDGRVLVTGGDHDYGGAIPGQNTNAEIYSPAYLFDEDGLPAVRPTVTSAPDVVELGDTIFIETPNAADIAKALWVVPGSVTHAQNWTQRANVFELGDELSLGEGGVNITLPNNGNEAPPGYYMLFLVDTNGVPSIAEWIRATPNLPPLFAADFDDDGDVDGDDLARWQANYGITGADQTDGDTDSDGDVDGRDFLAWQQQFTGANPLAASVAVPEPASYILVILGNFTVLFTRKYSARKPILRRISHCCPRS